MTKIKEILEANSLNVSSGMSGHFELTPEQLDTAASAIEKVMEEEMEKVIEWVGKNAFRSAYFRDKWETKHGKDNLTSSQLLHLYKNK